MEVFTLGDRPANQPNRRIFLTEITDPQGHSVALTYDSSFRLVAITDAIGQVTTLDYQDSAHPLRVTKVTDPFGRFATLTYDALGRLATVTDTVGMTSGFTYADGDFIQALTTPYGTTTFRQEPVGADRRIEATDPAGGTERLEYWVSHPTLASSEASGDVPALGQAGAGGRPGHQQCHHHHGDAEVPAVWRHSQGPQRPAQREAAARESRMVCL